MKNFSNIDGLILTELDVISVPEGDVLHGMKNKEPGYFGFGEVYFSTIKYNSIKAWKRHKEMNMNLVVPVGEVRFVIYDDRKNSLTFNKFQEIILSRSNYFRLSVPPMLWLGFQGVATNESMILNVADICHDPCEVDKVNLSKFKYNWE
jgi:dTDP-4-dehydrorhamnose 3,5-epimerase